MDSTTAIEILRLGLPLTGETVSGALTLRDFAEEDTVPSPLASLTIASPVAILNCVVERLDAGFVQFEEPVSLENVTVLGDCILHSCYFPAGFSAVRCRFKRGVDFRWGGHNQNGATFRLEDCEFEEFVDFEDDWFKGPVEIRGCTFRGGANLLGLLGRPLQVTFDVHPIIEFNTGNLDLNEAPAAG
jgi:hypothetical protein